MIKKKTKKETPKPVVTDEAKAMLNAATPRKKRVGDTPMTVVAKIQRQDLGPKVMRFVETAAKCSGMSVREVICCMVKMSKDTGRAGGARGFAPRLKRFSK
tara:strand:+ start:51 stop:353 length:303 start_codon:yes stop_codon:yes gene_type:complete